MSLDPLPLLPREQVHNFQHQVQNIVAQISELYKQHNDKHCVMSHTTSKFEIRLGFIFKRNASKANIANCTHNNMVHTPSQSNMKTMLSSLIFHHTRVYIQFSMWRFHNFTVLLFVSSLLHNLSLQLALKLSLVQRQSENRLLIVLPNTQGARPFHFIELLKQVNSLHIQTTSQLMKCARSLLTCSLTHWALILLGDFSMQSRFVTIATKGWF